MHKYKPDPATLQAETRISGDVALVLASILNGSRKLGSSNFHKPVKPISTFTPAERCGWCCAPVWAVVLVDSAHFYNCDVEDDEQGETFANLAKLHHCAGSELFDRAHGKRGKKMEEERDGDWQ